jgi:hypothetical protein
MAPQSNLQCGQINSSWNTLCIGEEVGIGDRVLEKRPLDGMKAVGLDILPLFLLILVHQCSCLFLLTPRWGGAASMKWKLWPNLGTKGKTLTLSPFLLLSIFVLFAFCSFQKFVLVK